jgi:Arginine decarboxylase (spermidine biosynthesis)
MSWTVADSRHLYNLQQWGEGYFDIAEDGQMLVRPDARADSPAIGLADVASELGEHSLGLPCLLRFPQILGHRVEKLRGAFTTAMQDTRYQGGYTPVYPIKVNQQRRVVEEILRAGSGNVGLEAGSKPELLAVLGLMPAGGTVICNGYKDREYIRLALSGEKLGLRVYLVVEKYRNYRSSSVNPGILVCNPALAFVPGWLRQGRVNGKTRVGKNPSLVCPPRIFSICLNIYAGKMLWKVCSYCIFIWVRKFQIFSLLRAVCASARDCMPSCGVWVRPWKSWT